MVVKICDAARDGATLLIGLSGPSGSGKTLSALRLATGMAEVRGGPVVVLDTEGGRAKHYAPPHGQTPRPPDSYAFKLALMDPPFSPERGLRAIDAVLEIEPAVLVIDSYSKFWGAGLNPRTRVEGREHDPRLGPLEAASLRARAAPPARSLPRHSVHAG